MPKQRHGIARVLLCILVVYAALTAAVTYLIMLSSPIESDWAMAMAIHVHGMPLVGFWRQLFERTDASQTFIVAMLTAAIAVSHLRHPSATAGTSPEKSHRPG